MNALFRKLLPFLLLALAWAAVPGAAQEEPQADDSQAESEAPDLEALEDSPFSEDADAAPESDDPLAGLAEEGETPGEDGEATGATMERFNPTEKISEDRSVAFPNDI